MLKKIVIIGPESTGKSTLCEQLAGHYRTLWCPEYAREYLSVHGTKYDYEDLLRIAKGQIELEERYIRLVDDKAKQAGRSHFRSSLNAPGALLFIDTDMHVMKVWCEFVFNKCHPYILEQIARRKYDLYLLCNIDLPWIPDGLREYPDLEARQRLYEIYRDTLNTQQTPWTEISGDDQQRLRTAIQAVDRLIER